MYSRPWSLGVTMYVAIQFQGSFNSTWGLYDYTNKYGLTVSYGCIDMASNPDQGCKDLLVSYFYE